MTDGCKVCRVLDEWELHRYDERLLSQWRNDGTQRKGYRQLARWLNVALLRREMDRAGLPTLGGEVESKYDRLRGEETNAAEVADILRREGIDVDRLQSDFVSYGVVRTHITECLGAEYDPGEPNDWELDAVDIARDRASEKIGEAVGSLVRKGEVEAGESVSVHLDVDVECDRCGTRVRLRQALRQGEVCQCRHQVISDD